jgi:dihydropteroate synthase
MAERGNIHKREQPNFNVRLRLINILADAAREITAIGADPRSIQLMAPKSLHYNIKLDNLDARAANLIKQTMLSIGGDACVARSVSEFALSPTDVLLMGTLKQYKILCERLRNQPFNLEQVADELRTVLSQYEKLHGTTLKLGTRTFEFGTRTYLMGILNVTPDSFSDGGLYSDPERAVARAHELVAHGADIIDVGGESSRPGSEPISVEVELQRVLPVVKRLLAEVDVPISIDTVKSEVARQCLDLGVQLVNDISGLRFDSKMADVIAKYDAAVVIMHMQGTPKDMQVAPSYQEVVGDIIRFLRTQVMYAEHAGIPQNKIIVDPGIGFGKNLDHNLEIIRRLYEFKSLGLPLLIGPSRKRFLGNILGLPVDVWLDPKHEVHRMLCTLAAITSCVLNGADIIRVHDVKEARYAVKVADAIARGSESVSGL